MTEETKWMGEYRDFVEKIIYLCNLTALRFSRPAYYNTPIKLTAHEIQIIEYIMESSEDQKLSDIAKRLGITRGAFSNNVNKLVEKGCLEKKMSEENKKNRYVSVTPYGKEIYKAYAKYVYEMTFKDMFAIADGIPKQYIDEFTHMLALFADTLV